MNNGYAWYNTFSTWFLKIALLVCVCMSAPEAVNNQCHDVEWYEPYIIG